MSAQPQVADRDALLDRYRQLATSLVSDVMDRFGVAEGIHPVWTGAAVVGPARTVWTRSGDNKVIHEAIDSTEPGHVLVINGGGDTTRALVGELICRRAQVRDLAGFVIDGAVRDWRDIEALGLPVFARGISPAGPYKFGPGHLDVPVAIGGVTVSPGDLVMGDDDGVVVIPAAVAEAVCARAEDKRDEEERKRQSYHR